jgi:hypothetical protein
MPKRSRTAKPIKLVKKRPARLVTKAHQQERDENQAAFDLVKALIKSGEAEGKNPLAVALGRMGGLKGGRARADKMSDSERRESAANAARARWAKKKSM